MPNQQSSDDTLQQQLRTLTIREREVLRLIIQKLSAQQIAVRLYLSRKTVYKHQQHVHEKLGVHSRRQLLQCIATLDLE